MGDVAVIPSGEEANRAELREGIKSVRAEWREKLTLATKYQGSKLAKRAEVLMLDLEIFEDRVKEAGGEDELVFMICAQVASGVSLKAWCEHYAVQRGLVWAFLTETPERFERYQRALRGIADEWVGETVELADGAGADDVPQTKLAIDTRFKAAGFYDRSRFGSAANAEVAGIGGGLPASIQITFVEAKDGRLVGEGAA